MTAQVQDQSRRNYSPLILIVLYAVNAIAQIVIGMYTQPNWWVIGGSVAALPIYGLYRFISNLFYRNMNQGNAVSRLNQRMVVLISLTGLLVWLTAAVTFALGWWGGGKQWIEWTLYITMIPIVSIILLLIVRGPEQLFDDVLHHYDELSYHIPQIAKWSRIIFLLIFALVLLYSMFINPMGFKFFAIMILILIGFSWIYNTIRTCFPQHFAGFRGGEIEVILDPQTQEVAAPQSIHPVGVFVLGWNRLVGGTIENYVLPYDTFIWRYTLYEWINGITIVMSIALLSLIGLALTGTVVAAEAWVFVFVGLFILTLLRPTMLIGMLIGTAPLWGGVLIMVLVFAGAPKSLWKYEFLTLIPWLYFGLTIGLGTIYGFTVDGRMFQTHVGYHWWGPYITVRSAQVVGFNEDLLSIRTPLGIFEPYGRFDPKILNEFNPDEVEASFIRRPHLFATAFRNVATRFSRN